MGTVRSEPLVIADRGCFWVGVERTTAAYGTVATGQMYVQYEVPVDVRHAYPLVLVHGGGGQGLDYLTTPDGRPGWATLFLQAGYTVYVVDRPGHGRAPFHADALGPMSPALTYELMEGLFLTGQGNPWADRHTQWPGTGGVDDPVFDQLVASQGPFLPDFATTHGLMQSRGAELLRKIGPAILMTHSMGGPLAWVVADAVPDLVKGIVAVEPAQAWGEQRDGSLALPWGLAAIPLRYDPPASDPAELTTVTVPPTEEGLRPYRLLAEPRRLPSLADMPIAFVTSEASYHRAYDDGTVALLRQVGATVDHLKLWEHGLHGNGHLMMGEKNHQEVAEFIMRWLAANVEARAGAATAN